jgi:deoxyribose-phosphate aldolase
MWVKKHPVASKSFEQTLALIEAGATRIGTSSGIAIVGSIKH